MFRVFNHYTHLFSRVFHKKKKKKKKIRKKKKKDKRATTKNVVHDDVFANVFNRVVDVKGRHPRFHALLAQLAAAACLLLL